MRLMQVHKSSSGDKPILPQPFDFSRYAGRQSKLLMRTDVKRREIWEWSDHTLTKGEKMVSSSMIVTSKQDMGTLSDKATI